MNASPHAHPHDDTIVIGFRRFTSTQIDDVIAAFCTTPEKRRELDKLGRTAWATKKLTALLHFARAVGMPIEDLMDEAARRASGVEEDCFAGNAE
jgi:hypothetical protein